MMTVFCKTIGRILMKNTTLVVIIINEVGRNIGGI